MFRKISVFAAILILASYTSLGIAGQKTDPISGEWHVVFSTAGQTAEGTFNLKLDGDTVTGTVETAHTGPGTLSNGKWVNGKLGFTLDFAEHESIDVTGGVKEGKLQGDFATEGRTGTWVATKRVSE